jgi:hypothetical protein
VTRRPEPRGRWVSRRAAGLFALAVFLVLLLVVVATARGQEPPPPIYEGKTIEEWAAEAKRLRAQRNEARTERRHEARRGRRLHSRLSTLRSSLREQVRMPGTTGEVRALLCIHRHEGAWNDPGSPYFGGLQMDVDFQRTYGATFYRELGTANVWPPFIQVAVGLKAVLSGRGFGPWPVSRRRCGV